MYFIECFLSDLKKKALLQYYINFFNFTDLKPAGF